MPQQRRQIFIFNCSCIYYQQLQLYLCIYVSMYLQLLHLHLWGCKRQLNLFFISQMCDKLSSVCVCKQKRFKCVCVCVITVERGNHNHLLENPSVKWPWITFCWRVNLIHLKLNMLSTAEEWQKEREREWERAGYIYFVKELKLLSSKWPWRTNTISKEFLSCNLQFFFFFFDRLDTRKVLCWL